MLETNEIKKKIISLKQQYLQHSPQFLKSLAHRITMKQPVKKIHQLHDRYGNIQYKIPEITKTILDFYQELHSSNKPDSTTADKG